MQEKRWFCSLLDIFGILSLTAGAIALGGAMWFAAVVPEAWLFGAFYGCLAAAVASFLISCSVEIFNVVAHTPDPRQLRAEPAVDTDSTTAVAREREVTDTSFPRAA